MPKKGSAAKIAEPRARSKKRLDDAAETVRQEIVIDAAPERVFDAWADPEEISRWYVERQLGDPRTDKHIVWYISKEDLAGDGEALAVKAAERGRRLILENVGDGPWRGTVVDVELVAQGGRTRVVVMQDGFSEALREHVANVDAGWACVLAILKEYVEHHAGKPRRAAEARRELVADPAKVVQALASADAIAQWAGEKPVRLLASTPRGAVVTFAGFPGVFTLMGVGGAVVWYTEWGGADIAAPAAKAEDLAASLSDAVRPAPASQR